MQDGVTETNHGVIDYLVVTPVDWWIDLPTDIRDQFSIILNEVTKERNRESHKVDQANKQRIIETGAKVRSLSPDQRREWIEVLKPVWKKFEEDIGLEIIAAAQAAN